MAEPALRSNRALLVKLAVVAVGLLAGAVIVAQGYDVKGLIQQALAVVRSAGPATFFGAMALLPAVGFPLSFFSLSAGSVFAAQIGMPAVMGLVLAAITVNMIFTYFLASRLLRPVLATLVQRLGYKLPQVDAGDATDLIFLLRVTVPFPVQNYLLGLAQVPFGKYLLLSCLIQWPTNIAFVLFGDALLHGRGKVALLSFSLVVALTATAQLVRKHYAKKKAAG